MKLRSPKSTTNRRDFLGTLALGAGALTMASLPIHVDAGQEKSYSSSEDPDAWFKNINGKHRIVFDVIGPFGIFPFIWPRVFLMTNQQTGTGEKECNEVVSFRHEAVPYALGNELWQKYKFGEALKIIDPVTKEPSVRNMFWQPKPGDFKAPGIGNVQIGINELQESGVMFCVCHVALVGLSYELGQKMSMDPEEVKKDLLSGILSGIQLVPSGIWAVSRAQEHGCSYCFVP